MVHDQWMYRNGVICDRGDGGLLQRFNIYIYKVRLRMEIGKKGLITEDNHLFNQRWINLLGFPVKIKKLCLG